MRNLLLPLSSAAKSWLGAAALIAPFALPSAAQATQLPGPSAVLFNAPYYACSRNFYVSLSGSDANSGSSISTPWKTLQHANDTGRAAGDCVNVAPGTYTQGVLINSGGNLASKTGYVVYRCETMDACTVSDVAAGGQNGSFVWNTSKQPMTGSYVMIDGFKLAASTPTVFGQGIELWDGNESGSGAKTSVHHVWILNSIISGYGQSGVQMNDGEYFYVVHNTIYNNSRTGCAAQGSGISFAVLKAFTGYVRTADDSNNPVLGAIGSFNNAIEYNVVYNNAMTQCGTQQSPYDTDGNNIIADTLNGAGSSGVVYPGSLLIAFNVAYNGGGRGIDLFRSENVTVANNSCYNSALDPFNAGTYRPCIGSNAGYNNTFLNNIASAITGPAPLNFNSAYVGSAVSGQTPDTWTNNISYCAGAPPPYGGCVNMYNGDVFSCTVNQCSVNPMWAAVGQTSPGTETTQPLAANFALLKGSPAIGKGLKETYLSSQSTDLGACPNWVKTCPSVKNEP
jgi:hypothetical protein